MVNQGTIVFRIGKKVFRFDVGFTTARIAFGVHWYPWLDFTTFIGPIWLSFEIICAKSKEDAKYICKMSK